MGFFGFGSSNKRKRNFPSFGDNSAPVSPTTPYPQYPHHAAPSNVTLDQHSHTALQMALPAVPHGLLPPLSVMNSGPSYPSALQTGPSPPVRLTRSTMRTSAAGGTRIRGGGSNEPWRSTASLAPSIYPDGYGVSSRSAVNLPSAAASRVHGATRSIANLNEAFQAQGQGSGFYDRISARLNDIIDCIDDEIPGGQYYDIEIYPHQGWSQDGPATNSANRSSARTSGGSTPNSNSFSKVWLYSNSRLPPYLPPLKVYMPTYPLLCLAAQYSLRVYDRPTGREREDHVKGSILHRTKAMTLKSLALDDMNTIVIAIRGSASFIDWAMNFRPAPSSPEGFLDDPGNLCHAGFLCVAKSMIEPVAKRLSTLLADDPSRSTSSLLITGHSAGGAVAQLLFTHMLSRTVSSDLTHLAGFFKRVHCITFGTPPVSLLPLTVPRSKFSKKSLFFSFVNEGDPVARADKAVVGCLLKLYATPAPSSTCAVTGLPLASALKPWKRPKWSRLISSGPPAHATGAPSPPTSSPPGTANSNNTTTTTTTGPIWPVPNATLSMGGRVVLLRPHVAAKAAEDIEAVPVSDELLRDVIFGDPVCHTMALYARRIEILATRAVTAGGF